MDDKYGSVLREKLKESMSEPFKPSNHGRYCACDPCQWKHEWVYRRASLVVGILAGLFAVATVVAQIYIKAK